jgi:hypothetical protein
MPSIVQSLGDKQLFKYIIGGCFAILVVGLLGSVAYNSLWDVDNKFKNLRFGRQAEVHSITVAVAVLAAFSLVLLIIVFGIHLANGPNLTANVCEGVFWVISMIFVLVTVILQGLGLDLTKFGDTPVASVDDYYEADSDFRTYYSMWFDRIGGDIAYAVPPWVNVQLSNRSMSGVPDTLDLSDAVVPFYRQNDGAWQLLYTTSVVLDWTRLVNEDRLRGGNPCDFAIDSSVELARIGDWDAASFKDFWCSKYEQWDADQGWKRDSASSDSEMRQRLASRTRTKVAVDSLSAYYGHNTYFIGINTAALAFLMLAVALDFCTRGAEPTTRTLGTIGSAPGTSK